jgi:hypothetical protein
MAIEKPGKRIGKEEFETMMKKYQDRNPGKLKSVLFGKETFERILSDPNTEYIEVFMGETEDNIHTVMIVGKDKGKKILFNTAEDRGSPCPPYC